MVFVLGELVERITRNATEAIGKQKVKKQSPTTWSYEQPADEEERIKISKEIENAFDKSVLNEKERIVWDNKLSFFCKDFMFKVWKLFRFNVLIFFIV